MQRHCCVSLLPSEFVLRPDFFRTSFPSLSRSSSARCPSVFPLPLLFLFPLLSVSVSRMFIFVSFPLVSCTSPPFSFISTSVFLVSFRLHFLGLPLSFCSSVSVSVLYFYVFLVSFLPPFFWCLISSLVSCLLFYFLCPFFAAVCFFRLRLSDVFPSFSFSFPFSFPFAFAFACVFPLLVFPSSPCVPLTNHTVRPQCW